MKTLAILAIACITLSAQTTTPDVGSGAPNEQIRQSFIRTFFRNGFNNLVVVPPVGNVKALGAQGLVQEFTDAKSTANKYAIVKPNANTPTLNNDADMVQIYPALYTYYVTLGPTTAGYPTGDSYNCPSLVSLPGNSCQYEFFDKPYALFVYKNAVQAATTNFALANPVYAKWLALGGLPVVGPPTSTAAAITSASGIVATVQTFDQGAVFNATSGTLSGRIIGVGPFVYPTYAANGGYAGFLGFPTNDEQLLANGHKRQPFEGGSIEYDPAGGAAVVRYPVQDISIAPGGGTIKLSLGDTVSFTATPYDPKGNALTDRLVVWSTSNSRILALQQTGTTVTAKAIGGGSATLTASSEGKLSLPLTVIVSAPCCGLGEGAPTPAVQQAFQDAVTRNKLSLQLPTARPVQRSGKGYVQEFQDSKGVPAIIAIADGSATAFVVAGAILKKYQDLGGTAGALGYPAADAIAGGRQNFVNQSALAGNPVRLVSGSLLTKWASLNYETGAAGQPTSDTAIVLTFRATLASIQSFSSGLLMVAQTGPSAGKPYFVGGLVNAAYGTAGGATGGLGLATSDESLVAGKRRQDYEGGFVDYAPADAAAQVHIGDRQPLVTATPAAVLVGTRLRLAVGGFADGATIQVTVTGQPDFTVKTTTGAYAWETIVPLTAKSGPVAIHAVDTATNAVADGIYTVRTALELTLQLLKASGDGQTGFPGAVLGIPLDLLVKDTSGSPVAGIPVLFQVSSGADLVSSSAVTDDAGHASAQVRLPSREGLTLVSAAAGKTVVTFSAQAQRGSLLNFPKQSQSVPPATDVPLGNGSGTITDKGAFLTAASSILRYYQNRGDLPTPNGFSDPLVLNQFLKAYCVPDQQGAQICDGFLTPADSQDQIVNPWRLGAFVGGKLDVSVQAADLGPVRQSLSGGVPVLLALTLSAGAGSHFVVATGVNADGGISVMDPSPVYGYSSLGQFTSSGATLAGVIRMLPRNPAARGLLITGNGALNLTSPAGPCGVPLQLPNFGLRYCDGTQDFYQLDSGSSSTFRLVLTDLGTPASRTDIAGQGATSLAIYRSGSQWTAAPQSLAFTAAGIVDAASFKPALSPGALFTVFGTGLTRAGADTAVQINGVPAELVAQSPFQVSGVVPLDLAPGTYDFSINSPYGSGTQRISVLEAAPAIFLVGPNQGAVVNPNGTLNAPTAPARRGDVLVVYCTGLGAVARQGALQVASIPVTVALGDASIRPAFAGLTPGFVGLYQVNVQVPSATPPSLEIPLMLQQGAASGNAVPIAIQ